MPGKKARRDWADLPVGSRNYRPRPGLQRRAAATGVQIPHPRSPHTSSTRTTRSYHGLPWLAPVRASRLGPCHKNAARVTKNPHMCTRPGPAAAPRGRGEDARPAQTLRVPARGGARRAPEALQAGAHPTLFGQRGAKFVTRPARAFGTRANGPSMPTALCDRGKQQKAPGLATRGSEFSSGAA